MVGSSIIKTRVVVKQSAFVLFWFLLQEISIEQNENSGTIYGR